MRLLSIQSQTMLPSLLLENPTRVLFFTGKGGVGKTSVACATAVELAARGRRVLLVSTDPASNLDEVLGVELDGSSTPVSDVPGLFALNIDPDEAAHAYRERVVGPYRGILPAAAIASMEEQLSGACTVEIAAFDEFSKLLGDPSATDEYDHVIFDTAPTGHTLRLLELPGAWSNFIDTNVGGTSCLGPLSGLESQRTLYASTRDALQDPGRTTLVLVARPESGSLIEAERTRVELGSLCVHNQVLVMNGVFVATDPGDPIAAAMEARGGEARTAMPSGLQSLPHEERPLVPFNVVGVQALRAFATGDGLRSTSTVAPAGPSGKAPKADTLADLVEQIAARGSGLIMTMGKGGVGKTTLAVRIAERLAELGHSVHLTTTDPAAHVAEVVRSTSPHLSVSRIDPEKETRDYTAEVIATAGAGLDAQGLALLEEDLRSPCTEEIAVFQAFAREVEAAADTFVVIDTAPTGHTMLLLDATEAYHREVLKRGDDGVPTAVRQLLPRLRDPSFTRVLLVTLPEPTPVHEAQQLAADLERAGIEPFAWIVNQALTPLDLSDPVLASRRANEERSVAEVAAVSDRMVVVPWQAAP